MASCNKPLQMEHPIAEVLNPEDIVVWKKFEEKLQLPLPMPKQEVLKFNFIRPITKWFTGIPSYKWNELRPLY